MAATFIPEVDPGIAGIYTPRRAGALAGVSGQTIGQWARRGLICPTVYQGRPNNLYSFRDVAEAIAVKTLLEKGFTHKEIGAALEPIRGEHPEWPLQSSAIGVGRVTIDPRYDRGVIVRRDGGDYLDAAGQVVFKPETWEQIQDELRAGGWIARSKNLTHIEVEPLKFGGEPTLRDRRWTVRQVALQGADEEGRAILRDDYGITDVEIREALIWTETAAALA